VIRSHHRAREVVVVVGLEVADDARGGSRKKTRKQRNKRTHTERRRTSDIAATPPTRDRVVRLESSVDARDRETLPKTVNPTRARRLRRRPTTTRSRRKTHRNPSRRRDARDVESSRSPFRLSTSTATPTPPPYSPPRRRDFRAGRFPTTTPTRRVSSRSASRVVVVRRRRQSLDTHSMKINHPRHRRNATSTSLERVRSRLRPFP